MGLLSYKNIILGNLKAHCLNFLFWVAKFYSLLYITFHKNFIPTCIFEQNNSSELIDLTLQSGLGLFKLGFMMKLASSQPLMSAPLFTGKPTACPLFTGKPTACPLFTGKPKACPLVTLQIYLCDLLFIDF